MLTKTAVSISKRRRIVAWERGKCTRANAGVGAGASDVWTGCASVDFIQSWSVNEHPNNDRRALMVSPQQATDLRLLGFFTN